MTRAETIDTLFDVPAAEPVYPERIRVMWRAYGRVPRVMCGSCAHYQRCQNDSGLKRWAKCDLSTQTHGEGTDWRARWPACGRWEKCAS